MPDANLSADNFGSTLAKQARSTGETAMKAAAGVFTSKS